MQLDHLDQLLQTECGLVKGRTIVAGVSGGPDSLCLLDTLHRLGYPLVVAHLDHRLRPESLAEARRVAELAGSKGLPFALETVDVAETAREQGLSIEEAARMVRYRFLFAQARRFEAQAVAVGHTADDQVETVLMHILRGAGLNGLKGMRTCSLQPEWDPSIPLVRPLLGAWRRETVAYCAENGLEPAFDQSNQDPTYFRNRLRLEAIPFLETYNPQFRQVLWRMADALTGDWEVLDQVLERSFQECLVEVNPGFVAFDRTRFQSFPVGIQRSLVRRAFAILRPGLRDIDFDTVQRALAFIGSPPASHQADLAANISLVFEGRRAIFFDRSMELPVEEVPQLLDDAPIRMAVPGRAPLANGWQLSAEFADGPSPDWHNLQETKDEAWLDAAKLDYPLEVRSPQPGERFAPLGMDGRTQKLSDFFINVKLPRRWRGRWPLVCSAGKIIWVAGYRPAQSPQVDPSTQRLVHLRLFRSNETD